MTRFLPWILSTLLALFSTFTAYADPVEVKLLLDGSDLGAGKTLYAFDANTNAYLSVSKNTNSSSIATFDLPAGQEVKFRYSFNGKQFFSNPVTSPSTLLSSNPAILNLPAYTDVQLLIGGASGGAGKVIYAFNDAGQYISYSRNTDSSGLSRFTIDPAVNPLVKFRYTYNGRQWFSSVVNTTSQTALVVPTNTDVTLSQTGTPFGANQTLYAFRASTGAYLNYSRKTNASGVASFTLAPEEGPYKFRYTYNGKQWFTDPVPFANPASLDLPPDTYVQTLLGGTPVGANKTIYAFSGSTGGAYLNYSRKTDANGIAKFTLPIDGDDADTDPDSYKFRYTHSGVQHFSPSVPSGASTSIAIAVDTKVQLILAGSPAPSGKVVYAFEVTQDAQTGDEILTYTNLSKTTDASGEASFSLGSGSYKFRHDLGGKQWFSSLVAQGGTAILTTPSPTYVSVNIGGNPAGSGKVVYAFNGDGSAYHNYSRNTNSSSVAEFYLEDGEYSFRYDYGGKQWFSDPITVPNTYQAQVLVPVDTTVTVLEAGVPVSSKTVYAFDSAGVYQNYTKVTDSNGVASFTLDSGDYKFRYSKGGKDWFSNVVSQGGAAVLTVPAPTYISLNVGGTPGVSKTIYVFGVDHVYHNYSRVTDASGVAQFYLTPGQYLFRYSFGGQDWFTDPVTVTESGASDTLIVPVKTQISLLQAGNPIGSGKTVYAFDENGVYLNYSRVTDANSIAEFSLDAGTYKFRYDFNGRQFFSDLVSVSGSGTASAINLPPDTNVTLAQAGVPIGSGKTIYAFSHSDIYQNYSRVTDANSISTFTLPFSTEPYKFRYSYAGRDFFSPSVPAGAAVTLNVANDLVVTVYQGSTPLADTGEVGQTVTKTLYLFDESLAYQNYSRNTNASSQATFAIEPAGAYKFRLTLDGYQHFSQTVASTTTAFDFVLPEQTQITFLDGETPIANKTIYVFRPDGTYFNFSRNTDSNGVARFTLPLDNQYKFRVDVNGEQYFTPVYAGPGQYSFNIDPTANFPDLSFVSAGQSLLESSGFVSIPLTLSQTTTDLVSATIAISGNAQSADYQLFTTTVFIVPGNNSEIVAFALENDFIDEEDQQVILSLTNLQNANAGAIQTHTITILDDDLPPSLSFSPSNLSAEEDNTQVTLFYTLSSQSEKTVSFNYSVSGSAQSTDHDLVDGSLSIAPYQNTTSLTFNIIEDSEVEGLETVEVSIALANNANFDPASKFIYTILEDDAFDGVSITLASDQFFYKEENGTYQIPVGLNKAANTVVSADVSLILSNASSSDISLITSSITFESGSTGALVEVSIPKDFVDEPVEQAFLSLQNIQNTNQGLYTQSVINILDIDPKPVLEFTSLSFSGSETEASAAVNLMITGETERYITFSYATMAPSVSDATVSTFETITLAPGTQSYQIPFTVSDDSIKEADEIVAFYLHRTTNAVIGRKNYTFYSILDDDRDDLDTITLDFAVTFEGVDNSEAVTMVVQDAQSKALVLIDEDVLANRQVVLPRTAEGYLITFVKVYQQAPRVKTFEAVTNSASFNVDFTIAGDAGGYITLLRNSVPVDREELTLMYLFDESFQVVDFKINTLGPLYRFPDRFGNFYVAIDDAPNFLVKPKATFPTDPLLFNVGDPIKVKVVRPDGIPLINHPIQYFPTDAQEFVQVGYTDENGEFTFASLVDQRYIALTNLGEGPVQSSILSPGDAYDFFKGDFDEPVKTFVYFNVGGEPIDVPLVVDYFDDSFQPLGLSTAVNEFSIATLERAEGLYHIGIEDQSAGNFIITPQYIFPRPDIVFNITGLITVTALSDVGTPIPNVEMDYYPTTFPAFRQSFVTNEEGFIEILALADTHYVFEAKFEEGTVETLPLLPGDFATVKQPLTTSPPDSVLTFTQGGNEIISDFSVAVIETSLSSTIVSTLVTDSVANLGPLSNPYFLLIESPEGQVYYPGLLSFPLLNYNIDLGGEITVKLDDSEYPVANTTVYIRLTDHPSLVLAALTNSDGVAHFPAFENNLYEVEVPIGTQSFLLADLEVGDNEVFSIPTVSTDTRIQVFEMGNTLPSQTPIQIVDAQTISPSQSFLLDKFGHILISNLTSYSRITVVTHDQLLISPSFQFPSERILLTIGEPIEVNISNENGPVSSAAFSYELDGFPFQGVTDSSGRALVYLLDGTTCDVTVYDKGYPVSEYSLVSGDRANFDFSSSSFITISEANQNQTSSFPLDILYLSGQDTSTEVSYSSSDQAYRVEGLSEEVLLKTSKSNFYLYSHQTLPNKAVDLQIAPPILLEVQDLNGAVVGKHIEVYPIGLQDFTQILQTDGNGQVQFPTIAGQSYMARIQNESGIYLSSPLLQSGSNYTFQPIGNTEVIVTRVGNQVVGQSVTLLNRSFESTEMSTITSTNSVASFQDVSGEFYIAIQNSSSQQVISNLITFPSQTIALDLGSPIQISVQGQFAPLDNEPVSFYRVDTPAYVTTLLTDSNGDLSVELLDGVDYVFFVNRNGSRQESPLLQSGSSFQFAFESSFQLSDLEHPITDPLNVSLRGLDGSVIDSTVLSSPDYLARFVVSPGTYNLSFNYLGVSYRTDALELPVEFSQIVVDEPINVTVKDSTGALSVNTTVSFYSMSHPSLIQTTITNSLGQASVRPLSTQGLQFKVTRDYGSQRSPLLYSGQAYVFSYSPVTNLRILDSSDSPLVGVDVTILDTSFTPTNLTTQTNSMGYAQLLGLVGEYYVKVALEAPGGISSLQSFPVEVLTMQVDPPINFVVNAEGNSSVVSGELVEVYSSDIPAFVQGLYTDSTGVATFFPFRDKTYIGRVSRSFGNEVSTLLKGGETYNFNSVVTYIEVFKEGVLYGPDAQVETINADREVLGPGVSTGSSSIATIRNVSGETFIQVTGDSEFPIFSDLVTLPNTDLSINFGDEIRVITSQYGVNLPGTQVRFYPDSTPFLDYTTTSDAESELIFSTRSDLTYTVEATFDRGFSSSSGISPGATFVTPDLSVQQLMILSNGAPIGNNVEVILLDEDLQKVHESVFTDFESIAWWQDVSGTFRFQVKYNDTDFISYPFTFNQSIFILDIASLSDFEDQSFYLKPVVVSHNFQGITTIAASTINVTGILQNGNNTKVYYGSTEGVVNGNQFSVPVNLKYSSQQYRIRFVKSYEIEEEILFGATHRPARILSSVPADGEVVNTSQNSIELTLDSFVNTVRFGSEELTRLSTYTFRLEAAYLKQGVNDLRFQVGSSFKKIRISCDVTAPAEASLSEITNPVFTTFPTPYSASFQKRPSINFQANKSGVLNIYHYPPDVDPYDGVKPHIMKLVREKIPSSAPQKIDLWKELHYTIEQTYQLRFEFLPEKGLGADYRDRFEDPIDLGVQQIEISY